jgi:hypothetical protein
MNQKKLNLQRQAVESVGADAFRVVDTAKYARLSVSETELRSKGLDVAADFAEAREALYTKDTANTEMQSLIAFMQEARSGRLGVENEQEDKGNACDVTLAHAVRHKYNMSLQKFLFTVFGIKSNDKFGTVAKKLGYTGVFSGNEMRKILTEYKNDYANLGIASSIYNSSSSSGDGNQRQYHWLLPEIIMSAVELGVVSGSMAQLIAQEVNLADTTATVPYIVDTGALMPYEIAEGGEIPLGNLGFNQKSIKLKKFGIGVMFTDEFLRNAQLSLLNIAFAAVGRQMARGLDSLINYILINGEQDDLSEQAHLIGVESTTDGFKHKDLRRVQEQMRLLGYNPTHAYSETDVMLTNLNENTPQRPVLFIDEYLNNMGVKSLMFPLADRIMFVDATMCLGLATHGGLIMGEEMAAKTQTTAYYFSKWMLPFKIRRAGAVMVDRTKDFATFGWSEGMDVETYMSQGNFKK